MTDDLVTRLRAWNGPYYADAKKALNEAADEIERLRAEVADYKIGINWGTSCLTCAKLLDQLYDLEPLREVCAGLDADTVEAALKYACGWSAVAPHACIADWKPRAER